MAYKKVSWKRNIRKIALALHRKIAKINGPIVAAAVMRVPLADAEAGKFSHLGISVIDGKVTITDRILPDPTMGRWSQTNMIGHEIKLVDEPMIKQSYTFETPNFGDWSNGSHDVTFERDVYQRRIIPAKQMAIRVELLREEVDGSCLVKCEVEGELNPNAAGFEPDLLYSLNLLQENMGKADVYPSGAEKDDYLKTLIISWQILPPGHRAENVTRIIGTKRTVTDEVRASITDRYDFLESLKPLDFIAGTDGFRRYFGARYADDVIAFENIDYGNAIYVMGKNWEDLTRLSRLDLLAMAQRDFDRIIHRDGWKEKLKKTIQYRLNPKN